MLGTAQEGLIETQQLSPQMCAHSFGHHQPEAVGGAHLFSGSERAVGKCGIQDGEHNKPNVQSIVSSQRHV